MFLKSSIWIFVANNIKRARHAQLKLCYVRSRYARKAWTGLASRYTPTTKAVVSFAESAALSFVPFSGGSGGEPKGSPVPSGSVRYANLPESPPPIGVGCGGFSKPHSRRPSWLPPPMHTLLCNPMYPPRATNPLTPLHCTCRRSTAWATAKPCWWPMSRGKTVPCSTAGYCSAAIHWSAAGGR